MRAAILGRGAHVAEWITADHESYDETIAVNCAINIFRANWLVALDPPTYHHLTGQPVHGALYHSGLAQRGNVLPPQYCEEWGACNWVDVADLEWESMFYQYSICAALRFASELGAESVDCFGCCGPGQEPAEDSILSEGRSQVTNRERWIGEHKQIAKVLEYLDDMEVSWIK